MLIQVYANNIVFTLQIRLCLHKIAMNYLLSSFFYAIFSSPRVFFYFSCFLIYDNVYPKYFQRYK